MDDALEQKTVLLSREEALEQKTLLLSRQEAQREKKRRRLHDLFDQKQKIENEIEKLEADLERLDTNIDNLDNEIQHMATSAADQTVVVKSEPVEQQKEEEEDVVVSEQRRDALSRTQADEILTDPMTLTMQQRDDDENEFSLSDHPTSSQTNERVSEVFRPPSSRSTTTGSVVGPLELVAANHRQSSRKKPPPPGQQQQVAARSAAAGGLVNRENNNVALAHSSSSSASNKPRTGTLFDHFTSKRPRPTVASSAAAAAAETSVATETMFMQQENVARSVPPHRITTHAAAAAAAASSSYNDSHGDPYAHLRDDNNFPWTQQVNQLLRQHFRIQSFRDHQKEIINATLSGDDVFVVMRTGGGKSLTYQLPALLEGRGPERKVTFVVSPLLSLIQDQEEQMNKFAPGSALSFTSGLQGGNAEHTRRWALVRDPNKGVCLVFVTPERVNNSNKLQNEMQKLFDQGRLGRFVVDECHCVSQYGHDFRPDYGQLHVLKRHFPSIPLIAVTATASNKVRDDVCKLLLLGTNYRFFRSTANRPNLHYSVRPKKDGKDVVADMAAFIKEHHARDAGIVYTFSRKDADTVADALASYGVVARSYHSDVSAKNKQLIHRSWMRNETQVVVATIAFGLGINKPDVRFVLHHCISKTLDAYYQESGRAGRDGKDASCVLYYSPKDVPRMFKMVHGSSAEDHMDIMVRYAQTSGNDAVCRAFLLQYLGEPMCDDIEVYCRQYDGIAFERRDVGRHGQTAVRLLDLFLRDGTNLTMPMLVKEWRSKSDDAPQCVKEFPPSKDGLSVEECERIFISLYLEGIIVPKPVWGAYDTIVYWAPSRAKGDSGYEFKDSPDPHMFTRFPLRENKKPASKQSTKMKARKSATKDGEWLTTKPKAIKRKKNATSKKGGEQNTRRKKARKKTKARSESKKSEDPEVIDLFSDEEASNGEPAPPVARQRDQGDFLSDEESSECEFEG